MVDHVISINMKNIFIFSLIFFSCSSNGLAQLNPAGWLWGRDPSSFPGPNSQNIANGTCVDPFGNVIIVGYFNDPSVTFGTVTLLNPTNTGMFLVKYDGGGNVLWAKAGIGPTGGGPCGNSVAVDGNGSIYVAGEFSGPSISFGSVTLNNTDPSGNSNDLFLVKYDANGNEQWARKGQSGSNTNLDEKAHSVCTDPLGDIYIAGNFCAASLSFGSFTLLNSCYTSIYTENTGFLVKYDANGNELWVQGFGGGHGAECTSVVTDANGNVFLTGGFIGDTVFIDALSLVRSGIGGCRSLLVKFDSSGNAIWAETSTGANTWGQDVCVDPGGNVIMSGYFSLGNSSYGSYTLNIYAWDDMMVVKFDNNGNVLWARSAKGAQSEWASTVDTDQWGNIYAAGNFMDSIYFSMQIRGYAPNGPDYPMYVVVYTPGGSISCMTTAPCNGYMSTRTMIAVDRNSGFAYVAGGYIFGPALFGQDTLINSGLREIFVAKYKCGFEDVGIHEPRDAQQMSVYPNPGDGNSIISYSLTEPATVQAELYDISARLVQTIFSGEQTTGHYLLPLNNEGDPLASGTYFVRMTIGDKVSTQKLIVSRE